MSTAAPARSSPTRSNAIPTTTTTTTAVTAATTTTRTDHRHDPRPEEPPRAPRSARARAPQGLGARAMSTGSSSGCSPLAREGRDAAAIGQRVLDHVRAFTHGDLGSDDVTLVVV